MLVTSFWSDYSVLVTLTRCNTEGQIRLACSTSYYLCVGETFKTSRHLPLRCKRQCRCPSSVTLTLRTRSEVKFWKFCEQGYSRMKRRRKKKNLGQKQASTNMIAEHFHRSRKRDVNFSFGLVFCVIYFIAVTKRRNSGQCKVYIKLYF